jgi:hypothetical protein
MVNCVHLLEFPGTIVSCSAIPTNLTATTSIRVIVLLGAEDCFLITIGFTSDTD